MKKQALNKSTYNPDGIGTVSIFLAILTAGFIMFNIWQAFF